jgi:hypothetical protein
MLAAQPAHVAPPRRGVTSEEVGTISPKLSLSKTDPWGGDRLKKIKELENNAAVMGQFVMWRYFLTTHGAADLYAEGYPFLAFAPLEPLSLDVGVPDDLWKSQEANPDSPLFDWEQAEEA